MNTIAVIIVMILIVDVLLNFTADILNLRQLRGDLPSEFEQWYDAQRYRKSQVYLRVNTRFGWVTAIVNLMVLFTFWFGGGFAYLDQWVRSLQVAPVLSGLVFFAVLVLIKGIISQPFHLYDTFVIEERFGFNQTTLKTYLLDLIKELILGSVIGGILLSAILLFFQYTGANAWWACWLVVVGFMLLMQYIAPTWIMPLFNRFEPLPEGQLRDAITAYARRIDFKLDNIFMMDGSKRSAKSNAFFSGFGRHRRIVLFDTLIEKHSVAELVAVLAHEMGHFKKKHILKMMLIGILQAGIMFYILSWFISYPGLFEAFYVPQPSIYAGLVFFSILFSPIETIVGIGVQYLSRRNEFEADRFAVSTAPQKEALAQALKRLCVDNLSNLQPHPFYVFLHYSHPPVLQRIKAMQTNGATVRELELQ